MRNSIYLLFKSASRVAGATDVQVHKSHKYRYKYEYKYKYWTPKYKHKYYTFKQKYWKTELELRSSMSTSTKYYISGRCYMLPVQLGNIQSRHKNTNLLFEVNNFSFSKQQALLQILEV